MSEWHKGFWWGYFSCFGAVMFVIIVAVGLSLAHVEDSWRDDYVNTRRTHDRNHENSTESHHGIGVTP